MTGGINILCVDDDPDIRTIAAIALALDPELTVETAASAEEALDLLRGRTITPDAILLDVMMPGMSGPAALPHIRVIEGYGEVPVIFMTARARQADMAGYKSAGAAGVIVKPFDPLALASEVRTMIERLA